MTEILHLGQSATLMMIYTVYHIYSLGPPEMDPKPNKVRDHWIEK